jgi:hypothetical protein
MTNNSNNQTSSSIHEDEHSKIQKGVFIWIKWTFATLGTYTFVLLGLAFLTNMGGHYFYIFAVALVGGILSGIMQWVILPRQKMKGLWILGSFIGSMFGGFAVYISMDMLFPFFNESTYVLIQGAIMGAGIGIGQWLILHYWVRYAYIWILTLIISWALIWITLLGCDGPYFFVHCTITALKLYGGFVIMSFATGAVIALLFTYVKKDTHLNTKVK